VQPVRDQQSVQIKDWLATRLQNARPTPLAIWPDGAAGAVAAIRNRKPVHATIPRFDACRRACGPCDRGFVPPLRTAQTNVPSSASTIPTQSLIAPDVTARRKAVTPAKKRDCRPTPQRAAEVLHRVASLTTQQIPSQQSLCRSRANGVPVQGV